MSLIPPRPGTGLQGSRQRSYDESAFADATGRAVVRLGAPPPDREWLIQRIVVQSASAAKSEARIYVGTEAAASLRDGTTAGNVDINDTAALYVPSSTDVLVVWSGATPGAECTAAVQLLEGPAS